MLFEFVYLRMFSKIPIYLKTFTIRRKAKNWDKGPVPVVPWKHIPFQMDGIVLILGYKLIFCIFTRGTLDKS